MESKSAPRDNDSKTSVLQTNAAAVRAVAAAVEGTLGPRGLNCMLVDAAGDVTITNDGSAILSRADAKHPAARILVRAARAQDEAVGDGTTTTAILASAIISEGVDYVSRGVPVPMLIDGMRRAVSETLGFIEANKIACESLDDPLLRQCVNVAARGERRIADGVVEAGRIVGISALLDPSFDLRDCVVVEEGVDTTVFDGILVRKDRMNRQMPRRLEDVKCLVLSDALEPEAVASEALGTERGFMAMMENIDRFKTGIDRLVAEGIRLVVAGKGVHDIAEERLTRAGCLILRRVGVRDLARVAGHTGAAVVKRSIVSDGADLGAALGRAESIEVDDRRGYAVIRGGKGLRSATILAGASTREVAEEIKRIADDACGAFQASLRGGVVGGGGSIELACSRHLAGFRKTCVGLTGYGVDCVISALQKPLAQIVANAGYNPLEKLEQAMSAQESSGCRSIAVDCSTGDICNMVEAGILDPVMVKCGAVRTAAEVAEAVLKINSVVRRKGNERDDGELGN